MAKDKVVYAYVVADLLHIGHLIHLERASRIGRLIVGVLTDSATMEKKAKPIISFNDRLAMILALECVTKAVPQKTYSPLDNVKKFKPDVLMESTSHKEMPANEYVESYGGTVIISPYYHKQSSSKIKEKIRQSK